MPMQFLEMRDKIARRGLKITGNPMRDLCVGEKEIVLI